MPSFEYLTTDDLIAIAAYITGEPSIVADYGLLDAAAHRPQASAFGQDAYTTIFEKAAALLHSVARNHALVDGNKRTAFVAAALLYDINGYEIDIPDDTAVDLMMAVITEDLDVQTIAAGLEAWVKPR